jgi:hypothetical protein
MRLRRGALAGCAALATTASLALSSSAMAVFPNFSDCPTSNPSVIDCVDVQSQSGSMEIKGFNVPLDHSLEIRGGLSQPSPGDFSFVPPAGTNGFFAQPVDVPGGLLGIDLPLPGNAVTATAQLAGPSSAIQLGPVDASLHAPIKLKLSNPLIGSNCYIGSDAHPVMLNLITGTTSPPPPNTPISGHGGPLSFDPATATLTVTGLLDVDNSFAIPGATGCGLGLGLINATIDAKLKLPSAAGNNTMSINNDLALRALQ